MSGAGGGREQAEGGERDKFIPIRKRDIVEALIGSGAIAGSERVQFEQLCRMLGAIFHYEYFDRLERLRDDYYYFNPAITVRKGIDGETLERARAEFTQSLEEVLKGANYEEIDSADLRRLDGEGQVLRVKVETTTEDYHEVRFFRRGGHREEVDVRKWFGLRRHLVSRWVYDNVILLVTIKFPGEITSKRQLRRLERSHFKPGSILIKYFRNIAPADLKLLFPKVRVVMSLFDKLTIAVPALAGGVPLLLNLLPTLTVLVLVIGFYLGISAAVHPDDVVKAFAALTGLAALVGLIMRQRLKYERLSLKYQRQISEHFYFRNVSNNAGIFDYVVGAAEEQECKEAFLAYYFLLTASDAPDEATLDARIEGWLKEAFDVEVDFEVADALDKLERLGLLKRGDRALRVLAPQQALIVLDRAWDNFFRFANGPVPGAVGAGTAHSPVPATASGP
ncbi:MAG TPA: DUF3754 domain-containing protein [Hyphomicrobiaceae bacterium]|nr:DUF3754 domain-containing protein [Hyphomicrobiaceae bacterium]